MVAERGRIREQRRTTPTEEGILPDQSTVRRPDGPEPVSRRYTRRRPDLPGASPDGAPGFLVGTPRFEQGDRPRPLAGRRNHETLAKTRTLRAYSPISTTNIDADAHDELSSKSSDIPSGVVVAHTLTDHDHRAMRQLCVR